MIEKRILISLIPVIIISLFVMIGDRKNIKNKNVNNILNIILCGFLSIILTTILDMVIKLPMALVYTIINKLVPSMLAETVLVVGIYKLFTTGLPEEISKWISIKISKPKTPYNILIHSIFIGVIFMTCENYAYMNTDASDFLGMYRVFIPIHIACQLIMALLMIKAYEKKNEGKKKCSLFLQILSVVLPIILHTIYNVYTIFAKWKLVINGVDVLPLVIILGICIYVVTFIAIVKVRIKYPNNETSENNGKTKINIKKLILVIAMFILTVIVFMNEGQFQNIIQKLGNSSL